LGSSEKIGNLFYCYSVLERKTSEMYLELGKKFDQPTIKPKIVTIAKDSLKHSNQFEELSADLIKENPTEKQCKRKLGKIWNHVEQITSNLKKEESLNEKETFEIINRLAFLEQYLGEEYSILENLKMLTYMSEEISETFDVNSRKKILNSIINDEKRHTNYLLEIYEILKKNSKNKESHPEFKFQNPDAWWVPSHSQITKHVI